MAAPDTNFMARRVAHNPRFDLVQVENELLLYDSATHDVIYLDSSALVVWRLCDGQRSIDEIAALIEDAYPESRDVIAADVRKTVDALAQSGALMLSA